VNYRRAGEVDMMEFETSVDPPRKLPTGRIPKKPPRRQFPLLEMETSFGLREFGGPDIRPSKPHSKSLVNLNTYTKLHQGIVRSSSRDFHTKQLKSTIDPLNNPVYEARQLGNSIEPVEIFQSEPIRFETSIHPLNSKKSLQNASKQRSRTVTNISSTEPTRTPGSHQQNSICEMETSLDQQKSPHRPQKSKSQSMINLVSYSRIDKDGSGPRRPQKSQSQSMINLVSYSRIEKDGSGPRRREERETRARSRSRTRRWSEYARTMTLEGEIADDVMVDPTESSV
jgi:hypothetical protein